MQNRLIRRVSLDSLKKDDQFKIGGSKTLYTYHGKVNGQHVACKWIDAVSGMMSVMSGKNMIVELVTGNGMPENCVFGSTFQKLLLSRKAVSA